MKKKWVAPRVEVQKFEANEYVAACWGVACDIGLANQWEKDHDNYWLGAIKHQSDGCGLSTSQYVMDTDSDGFPDVMKEWSEHGSGLTCEVFTNADYNDKADLSSVKAGDKIFWTTSKVDFLVKKTWHHQGTVVLSDPAHPNRS